MDRYYMHVLIIGTYCIQTTMMIKVCYNHTLLKLSYSLITTRLKNHDYHKCINTALKS